MIERSLSAALGGEAAINFAHSGVIRVLTAVIRAPADPSRDLSIAA